mmetsp:Transcript_30915/g.52868  ORF Transcript_30915/g.52868 Transcript_30915/m.52868 type:complete len:1112 (+) Transcript_30915:81-3416(+)
MPPQRAKSAFMYYQSDHLAEIKRSTGGSMGEAMTALSAQWKSLTAAQKRPYLEREQADRERYNRECAEADAAAYKAQQERLAMNSMPDEGEDIRASSRGARGRVDAERAEREAYERQRKKELRDALTPEEREERRAAKAAKKAEVMERQRKRDEEEAAVEARHNKLDKEATKKTEERLKYLLGQSEIFARLKAGKKRLEGDAEEEKKEGEYKSKHSPSRKKKRGRKAAVADDPEGEGVDEDDEEEGSEEEHIFLTKQPDCIKFGQLKPYQLEGLNWMIHLAEKGLNGILADEMGLGKTLQSISILAYHWEFLKSQGPHLVCVPKSTLSNWMNELNRWCPSLRAIRFHGAKEEREALAEEYFTNEAAAHDGKRPTKQILNEKTGEMEDDNSDNPRAWDVCVTTYEVANTEKKVLSRFAWKYLVIDEAHRLKNESSMFSATVRSFNTAYRLLLTGTPLQNNLHELWALLNFLLPDIFNSAENFDQWFNKPFASFGKSSSTTSDSADASSDELLSNEERMLIIHRLHELLRPFMLRRVKSEVLDQLPTKVEKVIRCELSSWQKELYKQISHKIAGEAASSKNFNRGLNNVVMQLRKVCNHPYLFNKDGYHINDDIIRTSGKLELLDRMLPKLKAAGHRVLMFTQMTKMMPILEDYFAYRGFTSMRLDGSTSADEREKRMYMFNAPDSPHFIFLLSTRAGGLGLNLATADTVIIFDSDWNPMMDLQAQDRAHRIGQRKDVRVFRIITQTPVEEKILSRATEKLQMNELVVEAGKFDKSGQEGGQENNSLERLKMMELLLTDFDQNQNTQGTATAEEDFEKSTDDGIDDEEEENTSDLLNEMISSNDDDYKLYCKMDMENTNAPALYNDIESVPDWILYPNGRPEEGAMEVDTFVPGQPLPKRRAAAGDIVYDDGMTEKQFCRMMDKKTIADEKEKKKSKKKRSRNTLDPSAILDTDSSGRKRAKTQDDSVASLASKPDSSNKGEVTADVNERLVSITRSLIYLKEKGTGRKLSEIFLEKPCPTTYPDYYQLIDKPIGMNDILRKCRAKLYSSVTEFRDDWNTLFKNCVTYNGEGTWITNDAGVLKAEFNRLMDKNKEVKAKLPLRIKLSLKGKKK